MPTVETGALVLVTGASGFLGGYIVSALLAAGYRVRITARSAAKVENVRKLFPEHEIEAIVVPEMLVPGAYDEAVKGIDGLVHAASPLDGTVTGDPDILIKPAVAGVENLHASLERAAANGTRLRRWVQISSIGAVNDECIPGTVIEEDMWNDVAVNACRTKGAAADSWDKYGASKTLAERAFWAGLNSNPGYDGVSINPSLIIAPPLGYRAGEPLNVSVALGLTRWLQPAVPQEALFEKTSSNIVDAADVGHACVKALTTPEAAGERFLLSASPLFGNDVALAAEAVGVPGLTRGNPDPAFRESLLPLIHLFDGSKAERVLGFTYRAKDETLRETVAAVAGGTGLASRIGSKELVLQRDTHLATLHGIEDLPPSIDSHVVAD